MAEGYTILLPWGSENEYQRVLRIQQQSSQSTQSRAAAKIKILPKMGLEEIAELLLDAAVVIAVDTGLAHLAAALDIPTIALFGPTNPGLTGTYGNNQYHLRVEYPCSPCLNKHCELKVTNDTQANSIQPVCYLTLTPDCVYQELTRLMADQMDSSAKITL
jgi:heptosyltransferase-1